MINAESTGQADEVIRLFKEYVLTKPPNYGDTISIIYTSSQILSSDLIIKTYDLTVCFRMNRFADDERVPGRFYYVLYDTTNSVKYHKSTKLHCIRKFQ